MCKYAFPAVALVAAAIFSSPAAAVAPAPLAELRRAMDEHPAVEKVACWRFGWRGWGVYPGCYHAPVYVAPPVYAPPVYAVPPAYVPPRRCWINGRWRIC